MKKEEKTEKALAPVARTVQVPCDADQCIGENCDEVFRVFSDAGFKYIKYEELDNLIIIYETVGHFDYHDDGKVYLKADASDELAIASFNSLEEFENSSVSYKLPTYAHTFQKNNDNYYWIMSEKVD